MNEWDMDHTGRTSFGEPDMTQPEALRLADKLAASWVRSLAWCKEAADELRRLHEVNQELRRLHEVNQDLLVALKMAEPLLQAMLNNIVKYLPQYEKMPALDQVRAAIAKAEGAKK